MRPDNMDISTDRVITERMVRRKAKPTARPLVLSFLESGVGNLRRSTGFDGSVGGGDTGRYGFIKLPSWEICRRHYTWC